MPLLDGRGNGASIRGEWGGLARPFPLRRKLFLLFEQRGFSLGSRLLLSLFDALLKVEYFAGIHRDGSWCRGIFLSRFGGRTLVAGKGHDDDHSQGEPHQNECLEVLRQKTRWFWGHIFDRFFHTSLASTEFVKPRTTTAR